MKITKIIPRFGSYRSLVNIVSLRFKRDISGEIFQQHFGDEEKMISSSAELGKLSLLYINVWLLTHLKHELP